MAESSWLLGAGAPLRGDIPRPVGCAAVSQAPSHRGQACQMSPGWGWGKQKPPPPRFYVLLIPYLSLQRAPQEPFCKDSRGPQPPPHSVSADRRPGALSQYSRLSPRDSGQRRGDGRPSEMRMGLKCHLPKCQRGRVPGWVTQTHLCLPPAHLPYFSVHQSIPNLTPSQPLAKEAEMPPPPPCTTDRRAATRT